MMVMGVPEKVSILVSTLQTSRRAMAAITARAQTVSFVAFVLMLAAAAWLVEGGAILANDQTAIFCAGALAAWACLRFVMLAGLQGSAAAEGKTVARLEELLGFYAPRRFGPEAEAVFAAPRGHKPFAAELTAAPLLVDVGVIVLLVAVISRGDWVRAWTAHGLKLAGL
ncbi:MAG TPA: hypothetical protein VGH15_09180 [Caulobacteraceae bacterium]|jgi:hypothetical protein